MKSQSVLRRASEARHCSIDVEYDSIKDMTILVAFVLRSSDILFADWANKVGGLVMMDAL